MANFKNKTKSVEKVMLTNVQRLMDIINNRIDNDIRQPLGMPDNQQDAAKWFINLLEPRIKFEKVENNIDPYQERLADCLKTYYKFNQHEQHYILGLIDKGIKWRGDSVEFMKVRDMVTPEMIAMVKNDRTLLKKFRIGEIGKA